MRSIFFSKSLSSKFVGPVMFLSFALLLSKFTISTLPNTNFMVYQMHSNSFFPWKNCEQFKLDLSHPFRLLVNYIFFISIACPNLIFSLKRMNSSRRENFDCCQFNFTVSLVKSFHLILPHSFKFHVNFICLFVCLSMCGWYVLFLVFMYPISFLDLPLQSINGLAAGQLHLSRKGWICCQLIRNLQSISVWMSKERISHIDELPFGENVRMTDPLTRN